MTQRREKIKGREGAFDDKFKRSHDPRRSGSNVCETERRSLFLPIHVKTKILVLALKACAKMHREGNARAKTLLLQALLDIHQITRMLVNMKEPVELEPIKKVDEIRRFSNKELRDTKESMGALLKFSKYCGPIRKKSYSYVSAIVGMASHPFIKEDIRDCFLDCEQAALLRFWLPIVATIMSTANQQAKLGFLLEEKVTAPFSAKIC